MNDNNQQKQPSLEVDIALQRVNKQVSGYVKLSENIGLWLGQIEQLSVDLALVRHELESMVSAVHELVKLEADGDKPPPWPNLIQRLARLKEERDKALAARDEMAAQVLGKIGDSDG
jgi:hypothetical protein